MLIQTPPFSFWSVWMYLSTGQRLFLMALGILGIYALFLMVATVSRVHKIRAANVPNKLSVLRRRCTRLQRLIGTAFYVFGIVLFLCLQHAHVIIDASKIPVGVQVLQNFQVDFIFAFNAFLGFLLLHLLSWFVETWVERCAA
jgi:hypothetical protein